MRTRRGRGTNATRLSTTTYSRLPIDLSIYFSLTARLGWRPNNRSPDGYSQGYEALRVDSRRANIRPISELDRFLADHAGCVGCEISQGFCGPLQVQY